MMLPYPYQEQRALSDFSTFGIGGPARFLIEIDTIQRMQEVLAHAHAHALRTCVVGKGSNILFDDRGFNGLVIINKIDHIRQEGEIFRVGGGTSFPRLSREVALRGYGGLAFASGIPGSVGGAIYMNAGASGAQVADRLSRVHYVTEEGTLQIWERSALHFSYRKSSFQEWKGAIVEGEFVFPRAVDAKQERETILRQRIEAHPYREKSAGCAFTNPPGYSAGQLIDRCGLKNRQVGGACVSAQHANFIVNRASAKAQDVLDLMRLIQDDVYQQIGVFLDAEIRYIAYD